VDYAIVLLVHSTDNQLAPGTISSFSDLWHSKRRIPGSNDRIDVVGRRVVGGMFEKIRMGKTVSCDDIV
jgi:hypothetical protein